MPPEPCRSLSALLGTPVRAAYRHVGVPNLNLTNTPATYIGGQTEPPVRPDGQGGPVLNFVGDSDAHIVRGLIAILFALYSGKPAREILATDARALFDRLGLREHLTPQRSNGLRSMVERIRADARAALAPVA